MTRPHPWLGGKITGETHPLPKLGPQLFSLLPDLILTCFCYSPFYDWFWLLALFLVTAFFLSFPIFFRLFSSNRLTSIWRERHWAISSYINGLLLLLVVVFDSDRSASSLFVPCTRVCQQCCRMMCVCRECVSVCVWVGCVYVCGWWGGGDEAAGVTAGMEGFARRQDVGIADVLIRV